jgi:hypothetical protein
VVSPDNRRGDATPHAVVTVEVEQAPGPGVDFDRDRGLGLLGMRARAGGAWLGFDRAALVDSDDGHGRRIPVLVAVPNSTFRGARLRVELTGGWVGDRGPILVGRVPGGPTPLEALARIAGGTDERSRSLAPDDVEAEARRAHQRFRERESHARITSGRAWYAIGVQSPELARFATPHSAAEYSLSRLPPRYVRGLEGLLDDDERLLYWIERPMLTDAPLLDRWRRRIDRRAALLALTDRQLLWIVDHAQPDRYLSDWGVDVELVPVERVLDVECSSHGEQAELRVTTPAGPCAFRLPIELTDEIQVMRDLVARFRPTSAGRLPRRRYEVEQIAFDAEAAARYGQEAEAQSLFDAANSDGVVLGFLYSPSRPGQKQAAAIALLEGRVMAVGPRPRVVDLSALASVEETLSPLVGRINLGQQVRLTYPSPLVDRGARFVRQTRRALAMAP